MNVKSKCMEIEVTAQNLVSWDGSCLQGYFMGAHCVLYAQYYWHDYTNCAESLKQGDGAWNVIMQCLAHKGEM